MKKHFLVLFLGLCSLFLLAACGANNSNSSQTTTANQNMDGKYHEFFNTESTEEGVVLDDEPQFEISGNKYKSLYSGDEYTLDRKNQTLTAEGKTASYTFKDGILKFNTNNATYVQEGSKKYDEILKLQEEGKDYIESE